MLALRLLPEGGQGLIRNLNGFCRVVGQFEETEVA